MKPDRRFLNQPKSFWAHVRSLSQKLGYTEKGQIKVPSLQAIVEGLESLDLSASHIINRDRSPTPFGLTLRDYFKHRAKVLNSFVRPRLMDKKKARQEFEKLQRRLCPSCPIPMNKQKVIRKRLPISLGSSIC